MVVNLVAALWGLAEGTLFFIVPDVFLCCVGLKGIRKGVIASLYALYGALAGGTIMYFWGIQDPAGALRMLDLVPSISPEMLTDVRTDWLDLGALGVFKGPMKGVPYKIYAVQAHGAGIGFLEFILLSIPARLTRFIAMAILAPAAVNRVGRGWSMRSKLALMLGAWTVFYAVYFSIMPN